jgi:hypothetical protein
MVVTILYRNFGDTQLTHLRVDATLHCQIAYDG